MQVCISLQADNHASTPLLGFFTGRMPFLPPNQQRQITEGEEHPTHKKLSDEVLVGLCVWSKVWIVCQQGADCLPSQTPSSPASLKFRMVIPFWHQLTQFKLQ